MPTDAHRTNSWFLDAKHFLFYFLIFVTQNGVILPSFFLSLSLSSHKKFNLKRMPLFCLFPLLHGPRPWNLEELSKEERIVCYTTPCKFEILDGDKSNLLLSTKRNKENQNFTGADYLRMRFRLLCFGWIKAFL